LKRIAFFGATGDTGKQIVEQALQAGYEVVAYARNSSKLNVSNEHLTVIQGELSDAALIETALRGTSAVLSALGPRGGSKNKPLTQGMRNIIGAMKKQTCAE
jgi:putative NADH-flavin reductase